MLQDRVPVVRRFSGGGTVIVDSGTIFVTFICNKEAVPNVQPYPRPIMSWSSLIYDQVFRGFVDFNLRENGIQFISIYELIGLFQVLTFYAISCCILLIQQKKKKKNVVFTVSVCQ